LKLVVAGGHGHVGLALARHFRPLGAEIVVLTRNPQGASDVQWDGKTLGPWSEALEGIDVLINLAGRSVNCRYSETNLKEMMDSRVDSTRILGQAIAAAGQPPKVWLQSSTATIYAHRFDAPNDEESGIIGGDEPGAPPKWVRSIEIAKAWERELDIAETPRTRKVALRSAMTMSADKGSIFDVLATLARRGLGGTSGSGKQYVSWIHETDFCRALEFLIEREEMSGAVNVCSPNPLPNAEFAAIVRETVGARFGPPTPAWLLEIGAIFMGTETELILKSRRVVPGRLMKAGFEFHYPKFRDAAAEIWE